MKRNTKTYNGMTYRQVQSENKRQLSKDLDRLRKKLGLKNLGWDEVIELYQWLKGKAKQPTSINKIDRILEKADKMKAIELDIIKTVEAHCGKPNNVIQFPMERINHG